MSLGGGMIEGRFATAEEAAAVERAAKEAPLTSEEARQQAQAEGLKLQSAANHTGYAHVSRKLCRELAVSGRLKPYQAWVRRSGESVHLGDFATAEEAALSVARSQAAARDQALQQAQAEGLTLRRASNMAGYKNVLVRKPDRNWGMAASPTKICYYAQLGYGCKRTLRSFATAEEAALYVARSKAEAAAAVDAAEAAEVAEAASVKEEMVTDASVKEEGAVSAPLMPSEPRWPEAVVKQEVRGSTDEDEVVEDHRERSAARPAKKRKSPGQGMYGEHARREHAQGLALQKKPRGRPPHGTNGMPMRWDGPKESGRWV